MNNAHKYECAECGLAVIIIDEKPIRACPHDKAAILANASATAQGKSAMAAK